jgi:hypothetical protein
MNRLRTRRACELRQENDATARWLIEQLWTAEGVGIVGGEPKCCKSFLALDMAVAVAGGVPCLRQFTVPRAGRVLLYNAEDAALVVRERLEGIAHTAELSLDQLDLHVITESTVRLDRDQDCARLTATVRELHPQLLILDPFVRLHRIDENHSSEVAPLLAYLRELQRVCHLAVVIVHHARKGGGRGRAGQELRGSSEFHAWGDSNLYLRRRKDTLLLSVEHRAAPSHEGWELKLAERDEALALEVVDEAGPRNELGKETPEDPALRVLRALHDSDAPLSILRLRAICGMRTKTVSDVLKQLVDNGFAHRTNAGYQAQPQGLTRFLTR